VGRADDFVTGAVDPVAFLLGGTAEEEEDDAAALGVHAVDDRVGKPFPTFPGVGPREAGSDGKDGVEEEHTLARPWLEVAVRGNGVAGVLVQLAEQVAE
jgi:hypothetical protein